MAVTFIIGRAGAGKTAHCLRAVAMALEEAPRDGGRLILLVPEQASFQVERALAGATRLRGYVRAEVLSFSRLAQRLFDQLGSAPVVVDAEARTLALRALAGRHAHELGSLGRSMQRPGVCAALSGLIEELITEGVTPAALAATAGTVADEHLGRKLRACARLYAAYCAWLGPGRCDVAARLGAVTTELEHVAWLCGARFWVDGFAGFTGQELQTLVALAQRAAAVEITLLLDPVAAVRARSPAQVDPLGLFARTEQTYQRLAAAFATAGVTVAPPVRLQPAPLPRFSAAPQLARLEVGLATPETNPAEGVQSAQQVRIVACAQPLAEVRAAARWIRTTLANGPAGLRLRDFAVIARDLTMFAPLISEVFEECELPYFLDQRRPLGTHPLCRLVGGLISAAVTDCSSESMVALLRTRLLPLTSAQAERLENAVVRTAIRGFAAWRSETWPPQSTRGEPAERAARLVLVAALAPLHALAQQLQTAVQTWVRALYTALEQLQVPQGMQNWIAAARAAQAWEAAETHRQAWASVVELLEQGDAVLGDTAIEPVELQAVLTGALRERTLGLTPPTVDQVLVSAIERSRHPDIRHAWVLGFNEGVFPQRPGEDVLLTTSEREQLQAAGLGTRPPRRDEVLDERLLAYIACTRPSQTLTLSYARTTAAGEEALPSALLGEVRAALPEVAVLVDEAAAAPAHVAEFARQYLQANPARPEYARLARLWTALEQEARHQGLLTWLLRGQTYENQPAPLGEALAVALRNSSSTALWRTSPSALDTYVQCPFRYFAQHALRLDPQSGPLPLRWDLGSAAHEILAATVSLAQSQNADVTQLEPEAWDRALDTAAAAYWAEYPPGDRPELVFWGRRLEELLRDVLGAQVDRWRRGAFRPWRTELHFDPQSVDQALPAIALLTSTGNVHIMGRIDRVDAATIAGQRYLLVVDYKSSAGPVRGPWLTGHRLQLFLYLHALMQAEEGRAGPRPAGVLLAPLYPDRGRLRKPPLAVAAEPEERALERMYLYRPRGLLVPEAARALDRNLGGETSPVAQLRLKKDGEFYGNSDVCAPEVLDAYLAAAVATAEQVADGVLAGCIDVAPLVEQRRLACQTCDFGAVCRMDRRYHGGRLAERVLPLVALPESPEDEVEGAG
ncbi:MAG: exodeoxyribonuclease V subunit gamma [Phycisphaerales bacterium]|nr:exodeoxyribonuclease V subunit gamma [Phycisphaerales bacterium]